MAHADGELATSRACARSGVNMAISSFSNYDTAAIRQAGLKVGEIAHAQQMYTCKNREMEARALQAAEKAGCSAVFLTADSPVMGIRYNEWRNDFRIPEGLGLPIVGWDSERIRRQTHDDMAADLNDDGHNWARDIPWLRSVTRMEIWIKGVVTAEDTLRAVEMGCDGIIVSNHGEQKTFLSMDCEIDRMIFLVLITSFRFKQEVGSSTASRLQSMLCLSASPLRPGEYESTSTVVSGVGLTCSKQSLWVQSIAG